MVRSRRREPVHRDRAGWRTVLLSAASSGRGLGTSSTAPARWRPWASRCTSTSTPTCNGRATLGCCGRAARGPAHWRRAGCRHGAPSRQHPRPACGDEPFNPATCSRAYGWSRRLKCEMICDQVRRASPGRECHAVLIAAFFLNRGSPLSCPPHVYRICQFQYVHRQRLMPSHMGLLSSSNIAPVSALTHTYLDEISTAYEANSAATVLDRVPIQ